MDEQLDMSIVEGGSADGSKQSSPELPEMVGKIILYSGWLVSFVYLWSTYPHQDSCQAW